jgi:hypothetical protein
MAGYWQILYQLWPGDAAFAVKIRGRRPERRPVTR